MPSQIGQWQAKRDNEMSSKSKLYSGQGVLQDVKSFTVQ